MKHLLQIKASVFSDHGASSRLADEFVAAWRSANPDARITVRNLAGDQVPHLNAERLTAFATAAEQRTPAQQSIVEYSDALIAELKRADVVVIGLPMYNFGVPSVLQAYFDHIARAGVTFRYTAQGPEGFLTGKKVYVLATRGGVHAGTALDSETAQVRAFLALLGMTDVEFIYAEGLNMGDPSREAGLAKAKRCIAQLATAA